MTDRVTLSVRATSRKWPVSVWGSEISAILVKRIINAIVTVVNRE